MYRIETERGDLFDVNMMIAIQATLSGTATENELVAAFNEAVASFEILNSKVVIEDSGDAFYDSCALPQNSIVFRKFELSDLIREQERIRFRLEDGEFLRCFVSRTDSDVMRMCFLMHHLGGDGKSLMYFIEAFLKCLNGEKSEYRKIILLDRKTLPKDAKLPLLAKWLVKSYNRKWQKERRVFDFDDMSKAYEKFWQTHSTSVRNEVTEGSELQEKLKTCKTGGFGFTSYTIAEMMQSISRVQDIGLAVDGRIDGNRTMSNQATGISVKYRYEANKTLIENAEVIDKIMKKKLKNAGFKYFILRFMSEFDPTLIDAVNLEFAGYFHSDVSAKLARLLGYGHNTKDISITNLTRADIRTEYGKYRLADLLFVPPVVSYGKNIIGMVTVDDRLNISYHVYR
ncbi:MAG: hypothetical protein IK093_14510 [Ruminiclostridium sp.]|nr:hypothetical protein [Ruminiclostridium sp.]